MSTSEMCQVQIQSISCDHLEPGSTLANMLPDFFLPCHQKVIVLRVRQSFIFSHHGCEMLETSQTWTWFQFVALCVCHTALHCT